MITMSILNSDIYRERILGPDRIAPNRSSLPLRSLFEVICFLYFSDASIISKYILHLTGHKKNVNSIGQKSTDFIP